MCRTAVVVPEDMLVTDLTRLLREKRIGGVPVMNKNKQIVGIVTVTDVFNAMKIVRRMHAKKTLWFSLFKLGKKTITVREIYTRKLISVIPDTPVERVVDLMLEKNIHTIPVMNDNQTELYGVVGRHDVTWAAFGDEPTLRTLAENSESVSGPEKRDQSP